MKKISILIISSLLIISCNNKKLEEKNNPDMKILETKMDSMSYSFGLQYAFGLKNQGMDTIIELDYFYKAFQDVFQDDSLDLSQEVADIVLDEYFDNLQKEINDKSLSKNKKLIKESNGNEILLSSGLKIMIIEDKDGLSPKLSDTVTSEISILDLDGNIIEEFPEPQKFLLSQVFPGLQEGIQLMNIGDKWNLMIPPDLSSGSGDAVIFQVELLGIN